MMIMIEIQYTGVNRMGFKGFYGTSFLIDP